jgi:hypothetical protein
MTTRHTDFEFLCALAVNGDLESAEYMQLKEHLEHCASCRECLCETRRLGAQLVLAQALKRPNKLPRGMRERFLTRAAGAGIPLSSCSSQGIGSPALGMVTALLMVLLLAAATLKAGPFKRFAAVTKVGNTTSAGSGANLKANSQEVVGSQASDAQTQPSRSKNSHHRGRVQRATPAVDLSALEVQQFHFALFAQDSPAIRYPTWTAVTMPQAVPSSNYPNRMPRLALDATSEVFRHIAPPLLAYGPTGVSGLRSNLDLGPPTGRSFRLLKVDFTADGYRRPQTPGDNSQ